MNSTNSTIPVLIASNRSIVIEGLKAHIEKIDLNFDYTEINDLSDINSYIDYQFIILDHKLLTKPKSHAFRNLLTIFSGKILIFINPKMSNNLHQYTISSDSSSQQIIEVLSSFFEEYLNQKPSTNNEILSTREIDVLREVAKGYANKDIAERLFISINTVITHRKNITDKLGVKTIPGLTVYALMNNLITPDDVTL